VDDLAAFEVLGQHLSAVRGGLPRLALLVHGRDAPLAAAAEAVLQRLIELAAQPGDLGEQLADQRL
jgi:hypothetical protein